MIDDIGLKLKELRTNHNYTKEYVADKTGFTIEEISLVERGEREPSVLWAQKFAIALDTTLENLLIASKIKLLEADTSFVLNEETLLSCGLSKDNLLEAINHCYETLGIIDHQLEGSGAPKLANLIEYANLSSIIGNLIAEGLVIYSNGKFTKNLPHTFPDIISTVEGFGGIEIKMAMETNKPKGHLPKPGFYLTLRYVLTKDDIYIHGKENRGDTVELWEVKLGYLHEKDFSLSNTEGDSGKTAVIKSDVLHRMAVVYYNETLNPYKKIKKYRENNRI